MSTALKNSYLVNRKGKVTRYEFEKEISNLYNRLQDVEDKLTQKADDVVITMALNHRREIDQLQKQLNQLQNELNRIKMEREMDKSKENDSKAIHLQTVFQQNKMRVKIWMYSI